MSTLSDKKEHIKHVSTTLGMLIVMALIALFVTGTSSFISNTIVSKNNRAAEMDKSFQADWGNALYFSGQGIGYASVPVTGSIDLGSNLTVEAWVKLDTSTITGERNIVSITAPFANSQPIVLQAYKSTCQYCVLNFRFGVEGTDQQMYYILSNTIPQVNVWYHLAGVKEGGQLRLYVNGILDNTQNGVPVSTEPITRPILIGGTSAFSTLIGQTDELRISNTARYTGTTFNYPEPFTPDSNTVALWHFNENAGSTSIHDDSGHLGDGQVNGQAAFVPSTIIIPSPTPTFTPTPTPVGAYGNAILLHPTPGFSPYITVGTTGIVLGNNFTVEGWYKTPTSFQFTQDIIAAQAPRAVNSTLRIYRDSRYNGLTFQLTDTSNIMYQIHDGPTVLQPNTWYHFAAVKDGNIMRLFINGQWEGTYYMANTPRTLGSFDIGAYVYNGAYGDYLDGQLDELRISNIALYHDVFTPPTAPFTADANTLLLYHFNQQSGAQTIYDSSQSGLNGYLNNTTNAQFVQSGVPVPTPTPPHYTACDADLNHDGPVDTNDLAILQSEFGSTCTIQNPCRSDIDHSGIVDITDFSILRAHNGEVCSQNLSPTPSIGPLIKTKK